MKYLASICFTLPPHNVRVESRAALKMSNQTNEAKAEIMIQCDKETFDVVLLLSCVTQNAETELDRRQHKFTFSSFAKKQRTTKDFNARLDAEQSIPNWAFRDVNECYIFVLQSDLRATHRELRRWRTIPTTCGYFSLCLDHFYHSKIENRNIFSSYLSAMSRSLESNASAFIDSFMIYPFVFRYVFFSLSIDISYNIKRKQSVVDGQMRQQTKKMPFKRWGDGLEEIKMFAIRQHRVHCVEMTHDEGRHDISVGCLCWAMFVVCSR